MTKLDRALGVPLLVPLLLASLAVADPEVKVHYEGGVPVIQAGEADAEIRMENGVPTIVAVERWSQYGAQSPEALDGLRQQLGALAESGELDAASADSALVRWLEEHSPRIAEVRRMGETGADEDQILESLEARQRLLSELAEPLLVGAGEGASRLEGFLQRVGELFPGADGPALPAASGETSEAGAAPDEGIGGRVLRFFSELRQWVGL